MAEHSIWGATVPTGVWDNYTDAGGDSWIGQQFFTTDNDGNVTAVKIYASGSMGEGSLHGKVAVVIVPGHIVTGSDYPAGFAGVVSPWLDYTEFADALGPGWNTITLDAPASFSAGDGILAFYSLGGNYLYASSFDTSRIVALDGSDLTLAARGTGGTEDQRGLYNDQGIDSHWIQSSSPWYGIDIVVDEGGTPPTPPQGDFSGTYSYGPTVATGQADADGVFTGSISWGPAEATGSAEASGTFAAAYGFGPAEASGSAQPSGEFSTAYTFGPATADGTSPRQGEFTAPGYSFGPVEATGSSTSGGAFTGSISYGPAEAVGARESEGAFRGTLAYGPAVATGSTAHEGSFAGTFAFGPATFTGPAFGIDWPCEGDLIMYPPMRGLVASPPTRGLVVEC